MTTAEDLQGIIQKLQNLSEDDFKEEDINAFLATSQKCLAEDETALVLEIILEEKNKVIINNMGWNLIGPIVKCIQSSFDEKDKSQTCLKMIDHLIQLCNPKELLLGLLEQIDEAIGEQISQIMLLLLQPLQTVLMKLGNKKAYSVGLSLATLLTRLSCLPVPYTQEQMQEDKHALCQCCLSLVQFAKPFVDVVLESTDLSKDTDTKELRKELVTFCFSCLKYPLLSAQLNLLPEDTDHPFRQFAKEVLGFLVSLREPLPKVFLQHGNMAQELENEGSVPEDEKYSADSLACLAYLLFVQHIGMDDFPFVFGPSFLVRSNMTHVDLLLKRTEESVLSKGLDLLESSLVRVENESLHQDLLEIRTILHVLQDLVKVMTLCPIEHLRKKSLKMLQLLIDKFGTDGKYKLFRCLLKTSNHAGVEGYIIQNIKNQIDFALKTNSNSKLFSGPRLTPLLHMVLSLPQGVETDLLQNSDRIMASLNLLRYLIIKDNENVNETGVWTELHKIAQDYLKPLHTGLNMSKAHYQAELKSTHEQKKGPRTKKAVCTVTAGGNTLPDMTPEMQLQVLQSALFTFDLIESVLARVEELIELKLKSAPEEKIGPSKDV